MDCIIHGVAKSQTQLSDFNLEYSQSCTLNLQSNFRTVSLPQRKSVPNSSHSSTPLFLSPLQLLIYFVFVNFTIPFHINGIIYYVVIYISHFSLSRIFSRLYVNSMYQYFFFPFIFISWRLITLQYYSGFCHTLTWIYMYSPSRSPLPPPSPPDP